jgi:nucleotide-binding universal stress UspA family protein
MAMIARRILVPLDGSETAEAALPVALEVATKSGGQLIVLRTAEVRFERDPSPVDTALVRIREAEAYLRRIRERIESTGQPVSTFLWQGSPAAAIVKAVQHYQIDVIVMTTHGRTGREQEMFGSVAEAVLGGVKVPVVVVRPTGVVVRTPPGEAAPLSS